MNKLFISFPLVKVEMPQCQFTRLVFWLVPWLFRFTPIGFKAPFPLLKKLSKKHVYADLVSNLACEQK